MQLASMSRLYRQPPSQLLHLTDPYQAWCLDEAIAHLRLRLERKDRLRPPKATNNRETLKRLGIEIEE